MSGVIEKEQGPLFTIVPIMHSLLSEIAHQRLEVIEITIVESEDFSHVRSELLEACLSLFLIIFDGGKVLEF